MNLNFFLKFGIAFCLLAFILLTSSHTEVSIAQLGGILSGHVANVENYQFQKVMGCSASLQLTDSPPSMVVLLSSDINLCNTFLAAQQNNSVVTSEVSFLLSPPPSPDGNWDVPVFAVFSATLDG